MSTASSAPPLSHARGLIMSESKHRSKVLIMKEHTRDSGCVVRCISKFEDHPHSHRWHAAKQAEEEHAKKNSVYSAPGIGDKTVNISGWDPDYLKSLVADGGIAGGAPSGSTATVK